MKAATLRRALQLMPLEKSRIKPFYRRLRRRVSYPEAPTVVEARFGNGCFEIRRYRDPVQRNIYFFGYWERKETTLMRKLLRPGDVFVDIGANVGWFTVMGSRCVGKYGKVVCFEPSRDNFDNLQANIRLNRLTNVVAENLAVSDAAGTVVLSGSNDKNPSLASIVQSADDSGESVTTVPFDSYWGATGSYEQIRLLKMDIEGAEVKALTGMADILRQRVCDYLIIEVCHAHLRAGGTTPSQLLTALRQNDYALYRIKSRGATPLGAIPETGYINILAARSVKDLRSCGALAIERR